MKLTTGIAFFAVAASSVLGQSQTPARCSGSRVRRSASSLSSGEWASIGNVLQQMHNDGWLDVFGRAHDSVFSQVHGNSQFFPFHRRFVLEFENVGRRYDPNFTVPYFDATESYRDPANSSILKSFSDGTNGRSGDNCVVDGIQANMQFNYPNNHCLRRVFDSNNSIRPWYAPEIINSYVSNDQTLARFREDIEYSIHGAVHLGVGGEMDSGYAAHDFIFMLHHANIDRLWWQWQNTHNTFLAYDGPGQRGPASLNDPIPSGTGLNFNGDVVSSMMVLGYGEVCYTYSGAPQPPQSYPSGGGSGSTSNNEQNPGANRGANQNTGLPLQQNPFNFLNGGLWRRGQEGGAKERAGSELEFNGPIPLPPRLTPEWIQMHNFDPERVEMFHKSACDIVEHLNNSTYVSPY